MTCPHCGTPGHKHLDYCPVMTGQLILKGKVLNRPMQCRFLSIQTNKFSGVRQASIVRLDAHPVLGPPNGGVTTTSTVVLYEPRYGLLVTFNSIYWWDTKRNDPRDS